MLGNSQAISFANVMRVLIPPQTGEGDFSRHNRMLSSSRDGHGSVRQKVVLCDHTYEPRVVMFIFTTLEEFE